MDLSCHFLMRSFSPQSDLLRSTHARRAPGCRSTCLRRRSCSGRRAGALSKLLSGVPPVDFLSFPNLSSCLFSPLLSIVSLVSLCLFLASRPEDAATLFFSDCGATLE